MQSGIGCRQPINEYQILLSLSGSAVLVPPVPGLWSFVAAPSPIRECPADPSATHYLSFPTSRRQREHGDERILWLRPVQWHISASTAAAGGQQSVGDAAVLPQVEQSITANLVKTFGEMIASESFTDVTLACDGLMIKAHKIVLSACSNYFRELFLATPCKHPIVVLKDMKIEDLRAIIDFMYRGEVNVSQNQLGNLLKTAEVLRVKGLTEVNDSDGMKSEADGSFHMNTTSGNSMDHSGICGKSSSIGNNSLNTSASSVHPDSMNLQPAQSVLNQSGDGLAASPSDSMPGSRRRKKRRNDSGSRNNNIRATGNNNHQTSASTAGLQQQQATLLGKDCSADLEEEDLLGSQSDGGDSLGQSSESESIDVTKATKRMAQSEARESIIANSFTPSSFTSIASTSSSSPSHAQSLPQLQGPISSAAGGHVMDQASNSAAAPGRGVRRILSHTSSNQREIVSTDTSLADGGL